MDDATSNLMAISAPFVIGIQLSSILSGICIVQTNRYYLTFIDDDATTKGVVAVTVILNLAAQGCDMAVIWRNSVQVFGDYVALGKDPISRILSLYFSGVVALVVQSTFAHRSWKAIDRNLPALVIMGTLILASFVGMLGLASLKLSDASFAAIEQRKWAVLLWAFSSAGANICITSILAYHLWSANDKELPDKAQALLAKAFKVSLTTGGIMSAMAVADAILFVRKNNVYTVFAVNLPRMYTISLLYTLNCRESIRHDLQDVEWNGNVHELAPTARRRASCESQGTDKSTTPWDPQVQPHPTIPNSQILVHQIKEVEITHRPASPLAEEESPISVSGFEKKPAQAPDPSESWGFSTGRTKPLNPKETEVANAYSENEHPEIMTDEETGKPRRVSWAKWPRRASRTQK